MLKRHTDVVIVRAFLFNVATQLNLFSNLNTNEKMNGKRYFVFKWHFACIIAGYDFCKVENTPAWTISQLFEINCKISNIIDEL